MPLLDYPSSFIPHPSSFIRAHGPGVNSGTDSKYAEDAMILEAITISWGYDDFLAVAAEHNRGLFDRWLVVTTPQDEATREVCRRWNLDILLSEEATRAQDQFRKGRLINRGMQLLSADCWRLHLDADIVLPTTFRNSLSSADLDPEKLYGADRIMVKGWGCWQALLESGYLSQQHDYQHRVRFPDGYPVGTRWVSPSAGFVPIGFFQLHHASAIEWRGIRQRPYPENHGTACRTDVQFGLEWDRRRRELLPEIVAVHLESEPAPLGANWNGRSTKRFGPEKLAKSTPKAPYCD